MNEITSKELYFMDMARYNNKAPLYIKILMLAFRKAQNGGFVWKALFRFLANHKLLEISPITKIGGGMYLGHCQGITINPGAKIGCNVNIHKGVTIGQENRGKRKGTPVIGNSVWIGVNATIVGHVAIGDDVLIAPNSYVNCDVPSHSVVFGNPCIVKPKENATEGYVNNKCNYK